MYLQRPDENTGGSRFLLALSLSTVTALAVAAPLAFKATVDTGSGGDVSDVVETPTSSTTTPSGPQIGPKVRSPEAKLPIGPGLPSDYPEDSTPDSQVTPPQTTAGPATTTSTTAASSSTTATTAVTASSTTSGTATTATTASTTTSTTSTSTSDGSSTSSTVDAGSSSSLP